MKRFLASIAVLLLPGSMVSSFAPNSAREKSVVARYIDTHKEHGYGGTYRHLNVHEHGVDDVKGGFFAVYGKSSSYNASEKDTVLQFSYAKEYLDTFSLLTHSYAKDGDTLKVYGYRSIPQPIRTIPTR